MNRFTLGVLIVLVSWNPCVSGLSAADPDVIQPELMRERKVGNEYLVGNTITQDRVIRRAIDVEPGQTLRAADLRSSEAKLAALGLFETVKVERAKELLSEEESTFKDIV